MKFALLIMLGLLFLIVAVITWDHAISSSELKILAIYLMLAGAGGFIYAHYPHKSKKKPLTENPQNCTTCQKQEKERNKIIEQTTSATSKEEIDLDKMAEEIMNSPNKIDSLITKAEELGRQYAFDEISELYKRIKIHLTQEEKIELLKELRVKNFVEPFRRRIGL
ncbi:MAG: hypothetical protein PHW01_01985 [Patescibacteria group bacterium]|nr:hypothetical protein [Patescibacteria group bacterium]